MILGIDLGTSAVKAVFCKRRRVVASHSVSLVTTSPEPGWSEQDAAQWLSALHEAVRGLLSMPELNGARVSCIGLSGQMHSAVLLDRKLDVLRPCILWNDSRSHDECSVLRQRVPDIGLLSGVLPLPGFTAPKIMWVARHEPDIHSRIAHVLLPKDFLGHYLHGNLVTDSSDAAGTLWLDQKRRRWSRRLCEASSAREEWLPEIRDGHEIAGYLRPAAAKVLGLEPNIPIAAGGGDAATGAVAIGATEAGSGFVSLGTSGQLFMTTSDYTPNPDRFVHAFSHTVPNRWYQMAAMLNGARPLSWLSGILGRDVSEVVELAAGADTSRIPLFLPYLTGERSPHGDPHIRGAFYGLEDHTDTSAICRSVIDAIAFSFADAVDSFDGQIQKVPHLLAIGGGATSDLLLQTISDVTGKTLLRARDADGSPAFGAALLAGLAAGQIKVSELTIPPETDRRFVPRPDHGLEGRLAKFRQLYLALKGSV